MRTNLRQVGRRFPFGWGEVSHGTALAAALACVEQSHDKILIPSSYPYDCPIVPWGSTPQADPLLGSESRPLWHDGARFDKLGKVLAIAHDPAFAADLRVCFKGGGQHDRNCGHCFKCWTTQASFWLAGVEEPPCFETRAEPGDLAKLELIDPYKVFLGKRMHDLALERGRNDIAEGLATALAQAGEETGGRSGLAR